MRPDPRCSLALVTVAAAIGCRAPGEHRASPSPTHVTIEVPPRASAAQAIPSVPAADVDASTDAAELEDREVRCSEGRWQQAQARLARVRHNGALDEKVKAFQAALAIRPRDAKLRRELMHVLYDAQQCGGAFEQARMVAALDGADELVWTVMARCAPPGTRPETVRAWRARAARLDPNGVAAAELGPGSRCPAALYRLTQGALEIVRGWRGVFAYVEPMRMVQQDLPAPVTEAQARERTCIHNNISEITARNVCDGPGPWDVQTGHMHFHDHRVIILPLPAGRFALYPYYTGNECRGGSDATARVVGGVIEVKADTIELISTEVSDCESGFSDMLSGPCLGGVDHETLYFSATTGKGLVMLLEPKAIERYTVTGSKLTREAAPGCRQTIDLARLPPELSPREEAP